MALTQEQLRSFKNTYKTPRGLGLPSREEMSRTFGGKIAPCDYDGYTSLSYMGRKIYSDWCFDRSCVIDDKLRSGNWKERVPCIPY